MKKLRLDFEQLTVESFDVTSDAVRARGTVRGRVSYPFATCVNTDCNQNTCADTCRTCPDTCWYTCGVSCGGTCESCDGCASDGETCFSCEGTCPPNCTWAKAPC